MDKRFRSRIPFFELLYILYLLFTISTTACAESATKQTAVIPSSPAKPAIASKAAAVTRAEQVIKKHQLSRLSRDCYVLSVGNEPVKGRYMIDAREYHGEGCGGDPKVSLRLFSLEIEQISGRVWTDADSLTGEYRLLE